MRTAGSSIEGAELDAAGHQASPLTVLGRAAAGTG
jgi:hypothetical protein